MHKRGIIRLMHRYMLTNVHQIFFDIIEIIWHNISNGWGFPLANLDYNPTIADVHSLIAWFNRRPRYLSPTCMASELLYVTYNNIFSKNFLGIFLKNVTQKIKPNPSSSRRSPPTSFSDLTGTLIISVRLHIFKYKIYLSNLSDSVCRTFNSIFIKKKL